MVVEIILIVIVVAGIIVTVVLRVDNFARGLIQDYHRGGILEVKHSEDRTGFRIGGISAESPRFQLSSIKRMIED